MKTKQALLVALLFVVLHVGSVFSQVNTYSFSQYISPYSPGLSGNQIGTLMQDDDLSLINLPFTFTFNSIPYNQVYVSSNGFLSFVQPQPIEYFPVSGSTQNVISAFGQDLLMGTVVIGDLTSGSQTITNVTSTLGLLVGDSLLDTGLEFGGINPTITAISGSDIVVNVTPTISVALYDMFIKNGELQERTLGISPSRIHEIEFINFTRYGVYHEILNFRIRLYETTNKIEIVYGSIVPFFASYESEVGLKGNSQADFNSRKLTTSDTWSTSVSATQITDNCAFDPYTYPEFGWTFCYEPQNCVTPTLTANSSSTLICTGQSATISVNGASTYSWSNGSNSSQLIVQPLVNTTYTVIGLNGACTASLAYTQIVSNCTFETENDLLKTAIKQYPNPFDETLFLENTSDNEALLSVFNFEGKLIYSGILSAGSKTQLNTFSWEKGIYLVNVTEEKSVKSTKLIKN
ncbi:MAG: T9SS type A sorting domain-containing protein [Bacteroidia bacterium]|jgi:hypothetical protein|nr:T9SS type A sorting domain-containing protein [Bacteroidia bacterium]